MKYERIAKGANGRRWKITHELLDGPAPKARKARQVPARSGSSAGKKGSKKRAAKGAKAPRSTAKPAKKPSKSIPAQKSAQGSAKRGPKPEQLRLVLLG